MPEPSAGAASAPGTAERRTASGPQRIAWGAIWRASAVASGRPVTRCHTSSRNRSYISRDTGPATSMRSTPTAASRAPQSQLASSGTGSWPTIVSPPTNENSSGPPAACSSCSRSNDASSARSRAGCPSA